MKYPKFIVLKKSISHSKNVLPYELRLGMVDWHSDLVKPIPDKKFGNVCIGGGLFEIVENKKEIWLYGYSTDFGKVENKILKQIELNDYHKNQLRMIDKYKNYDFSGYKFIVKDF